MDKQSIDGEQGPIRRAMLRWIAIYLGLWFMPSPLGELPWVGGPVSRFISSAKERSAQWLSGVWPGAEPVAIKYSSGSDRTMDYYSAAFLIILSGSIAGILAVRRLDTQREAKLIGWLSGYLRLVLACTMVLYGLAKVFPLQFVVPGPRILTMKVGDLTPEDLMWVFMGASVPYTVFAGVAEVIGGALLLWQRTSALGASILLLVMANVTLMDLCYDVNMKLAAIHLLLAIMFVLAPEVPRIARALLQSARTNASTGWQSRAGMIARYAIFTLVAGRTLHGSWTTAQEMNVRHPLHGIWTVLDATATANDGNPNGLHSMTIQGGGIVMIGRDHSRKLYRMAGLDAKLLSLLDAESGKPIGTLRVSATSQSELSLVGDLAGEPLRLNLGRSEPDRLSSHRFHWATDHEAMPR